MMRIAVLLAFLILIVAAFVPRAGDESPPNAPSSTTEAGAPVPETAAESAGEDPSDDDPAVPRDGKLRFRVLAGLGGPPVPGAVVRVHRRAFEDWVEAGRATADDEGLVEIRGLESGRAHQGVAGAAGRGRVWVHSLIPAADPPATQVHLPDPRPLGGRVFDAVTGTPVAGARVRTRDSRPPSRWGRAEVAQGPVIDETRTGNDGRFTISSAGRLLEAAAEGHATARLVVSPSTRTVDIRLAPGAVLAGRITDPVGEAVSGARVMAAPVWTETHAQKDPTRWRLGSGMRGDPDDFASSDHDLFAAESAVTDAAGRYRLSDLAARQEHLVWVLVDGRPRAPIRVVLTDGRPCDIRLPRPATLTVRLDRADGGELSVDLDPKGGRGWRVEKESESPDSVRFENIVPGTYEVGVHPEHFDAKWVDVTIAEGEEATLDVEIGPPPTETVEVAGVVVNDRGRPVPGARVSCRDGIAPQEVKADEAGRFTIRVAAGKPPSLRASAKGHFRGENTGGATRIVLARKLRHRVRLRAPADGPPIGRCKVEGGDHAWATFEIAVEGSPRTVTFTVETDPGVSVIRVSPDGYLPVTIPVPEGAESGVELAEVLLEIGARLGWRVTGKDGRVLPGAEVSARQRNGQHIRTAKTDAEGRAVVSGLYPGEEVSANIHASGYLGGLWTGKPGAKEVHVPLDVMARLEGEVRYADGVPASAVRIRATLLHDGVDVARQDSTRADRAGRFILSLPPGEYRLEFEPRTSADEPKTTSRRVTLHADKDNVHRFEIPRP